MTRQKIKHSAFGSQKQVQRICACSHSWEPLHGVIFDYLPVDARCRQCGTYYSEGRDEVMQRQDWVTDVWRFNEAIGTPSRTEPGWPPEEDLQLAARLIEEEHRELCGALGTLDLPDVVDAALDSVYVLLGLLYRLGVNPQPLWAEIQRANMGKLGGPKREDGKQLKPDGWQPPDIKGELKKQGWKG
jgi:hypothetical protein